MKRIILGIVISFSLNSLALDQRDYKFIESPKTINRNGGKILSSQNVKHDLKQLFFALDFVYSGKKHLPGKQFSQLYSNLNKIKGQQKAQKLCQKIDTLFEQVSDSHLNAKFNDKNCAPTTTHTKASVGKNFHLDQDIPWAVQVESKGQAKSLLISITSFPSRTNPIWGGLLEQVQLGLGQVDFIVLDMRGNGGGDDTIGFELAQLLAGADLAVPYARQNSNYNPSSWQIFVNYYDYQIRKFEDRGESVPPYLISNKKEIIRLRNKSLNNESTDFYDSQSSETESVISYKANPNKPIYILIDKACASSCESTTDYFEYNELVTTVGENTAGYVHFANNGTIILRNSGIRLQMGISYNSYKDGRFIEKTGIPPKIVVPAGSDALDFAWANFFKLTEKN